MVCIYSFTLIVESLGEQRIRDINDEINRMLKEKSQWEKRIIELGGPDFRVIFSPIEKVKILEI